MPEGAQAVQATKKVAMKGLELVTDYLLPIATVFVGVFTGAETWGGLNALGAAVSQASDQINPSFIRLAGAGLFGGMFAGVGYGFWHLDGHMILKAAGRAIGGYFIGVALSYLLVALQQKSVGDGLIDNLIADVKGL